MINGSQIKILCNNEAAQNGFVNVTRKKKLMQNWNREDQDEIRSRKSRKLPLIHHGTLFMLKCRMRLLANRWRRGGSLHGFTPLATWQPNARLLIITLNP